MTEPRIKKGIALRRDQIEAVKAIAREEKHGNFSLIVQRAVDREIEEKREASA